MLNANECQQHAGIVVEIQNIKKWQEHHDEVTHVQIDKDLKSLANRLPNWATLIITGMGTTIGYLVALVKLGMN